jgi:four helix bundle protein
LAKKLLGLRRRHLRLQLHFSNYPLIKSGTSIGANYGEADDAESGRDFKHKIGICKKETREIKHWLRMVAVAVPKLKEETREL